MKGINYLWDTGKKNICLTVKLQEMEKVIDWETAMVQTQMLWRNGQQIDRVRMGNGNGLDVRVGERTTDGRVTDWETAMVGTHTCRTKGQQMDKEWMRLRNS